MTQSLFVVLQEDLPDATEPLDEAEERLLARHVERLDVLAERIGVAPLLSFFSADPEELAEAMNDEEDDDEDEDDGDAAAGAPARIAGEMDDDEPTAQRWQVGAAGSEDAEPGDGATVDEAGAQSGAFIEQWYEPASGLETVRALIEHVSREPGSINDSQAVLAALGKLERTLDAAARANLPFHVAMDDAD